MMMKQCGTEEYQQVRFTYVKDRKLKKFRKNTNPVLYRLLLSKTGMYIDIIGKAEEIKLKKEKVLFCPYGSQGVLTYHYRRD